MNRSHPGWVWGQECLSLLSLLLDINKDFLPSFQTESNTWSFTREDLPTHPSELAASIALEQLAPFSWSSIINLFSHRMSTHIICCLSLNSTPNLLTCVYLSMFSQISWVATVSTETEAEIIPHTHRFKNDIVFSNSNKVWLLLESAGPRYTRWNVHFMICITLFSLLKYQILRRFCHNWIRPDQS